MDNTMVVEGMGEGGVHNDIEKFTPQCLLALFFPFFFLSGKEHVENYLLSWTTSHASKFYCCMLEEVLNAKMVVNGHTPLPPAYYCLVNKEAFISVPYPK